MWIHDFERKKCHISSIIQCLGVKGILNLKSLIFLFAVQLDAGVPCYQPLQAGEMLALVLVGLLTEKCLTHDNCYMCHISSTEIQQKPLFVDEKYWQLMSLEMCFSQIYPNAVIMYCAEPIRSTT